MIAIPENTPVETEKECDMPAKYRFHCFDRLIVGSLTIAVAGAEALVMIAAQQNMVRDA